MPGLPTRTEAKEKESRTYSSAASPLPQGTDCAKAFIYCIQEATSHTTLHHNSSPLLSLSGDPWIYTDVDDDEWYVWHC